MQVLTVTIIYDFRAVYSYSSDSLSPQILDQSQRAVRVMNFFTFVLQPLTLFFPLQILLDSKFRKRSGRSFPLLTFEHLLHFSILIANVVVFS